MKSTALAELSDCRGAHAPHARYQVATWSLERAAKADRTQREPWEELRDASHRAAAALTLPTIRARRVKHPEMGHYVTDPVMATGKDLMMGPFNCGEDPWVPMLDPFAEAGQELHTEHGLSREELTIDVTAGARTLCRECAGSHCRGVRESLDYLHILSPTQLHERARREESVAALAKPTHMGDETIPPMEEPPKRKGFQAAWCANCDQFREQNGAAIGCQCWRWCDMCPRQLCSACPCRSPVCATDWPICAPCESYCECDCKVSDDDCRDSEEELRAEKCANR
jgi:hypothetical protein